LFIHSSILFWINGHELFHKLAKIRYNCKTCLSSCCFLMSSILFCPIFWWWMMHVAWIRGWGGVWYFNFCEVRDYVVLKTSLIKIYIGIAIIQYSFWIFLLEDENLTGVIIYNFKARHPCLKIINNKPVEHSSTIAKYLNIKTSEKFEIAALNNESVWLWTLKLYTMWLQQKPFGQILNARYINMIWTDSRGIRTKRLLTTSKQIKW